MPGGGATGASAAGVPLTGIRGRWFGSLVIIFESILAGPTEGLPLSQSSHLYETVRAR
jgi:hypothetical protein